MHTSLVDAVQHTLLACRRGRNTCARLASYHKGGSKKGGLLFHQGKGSTDFPMDRFTSLSPRKERGTALIFALVMLLMLTILGITAITTSSLQEKMAGNMRDQYTALLAGDSILHDGEALVFNQINKPAPGCPPSGAVPIWDSINEAGLPSCLTNVATKDDNWWATNGLTSALTNDHTSQEPRYVVELIQRVKGDLTSNPPIYKYYFRTTGWASGYTNYAQSMLQSVFSKRSDEYLP
jgi:type IV pilus assembly protein PilX